MAVREPLSKRAQSAEKKTTSDAQRAAAKPKAKAKVKAKARAEPKKANAGILLSRDQEAEDDPGGLSDTGQTR